LQQHGINVYLHWLQREKKFKMQPIQTTGNKHNINVAKKSTSFEKSQF